MNQSNSKHTMWNHYICSGFPTLAVPSSPPLFWGTCAEVPHIQHMALLWGHARVALRCECSRVIALKCDECVALLLSHALAALRSPKLSAQVTLARVPK